MDDSSDQDNEIEIISEAVKPHPQSNNDDSRNLLNQAVKGKLMQQYRGLELTGKKIQVVSSQGGVIDPSRLKIKNVSRIPLRKVQMPSVRHFPGVTNNNASTSASPDKENTPPGGSKEVQDRDSRCPSDQSLFSISSDEEKRSTLSPEPRPGPQRLTSSSLELISLSSDDEHHRSPERISDDSPGFYNNNNSQSIPEAEDRLEKDDISSTDDAEPDPYLEKFHPLDTIKARLIEEKISSESFLKSCLDFNLNWIRLDMNWNVEISSLALKRAFGADIIDQIINSSPVHLQSDICDDLQSLGDECYERNIGNNQQTEEDTPADELEDVNLGNFLDPGDEVCAVLDPGTWSTDALLDWGKEAEDEQVSDGDTQEDEDGQSVSPPSLYHRPREEMMAMLGLVTHEQARITR